MAENASNRNSQSRLPSRVSQAVYRPRYDVVSSLAQRASVQQRGSTLGNASAGGRGARAAAAAVFPVPDRYAEAETAVAAQLDRLFAKSCHRSRWAWAARPSGRGRSCYYRPVDGRKAAEKSPCRHQHGRVGRCQSEHHDQRPGPGSDSGAGSVRRSKSDTRPKPRSESCWDR